MIEVICILIISVITISRLKKLIIRRIKSVITISWGKKLMYIRWCAHYRDDSSSLYDERSSNDELIEALRTKSVRTW